MISRVTGTLHRILSIVSILRTLLVPADHRGLLQYTVLKPSECAESLKRLYAVAA